MRVLAVGAHPDDIEILCAGTLARCKARGDEIFIGVATNGEQGHYEIQPQELAEIRRSEAQAAADLLGAQLFWLGFPDQFIYHDHETRLKFIEMVREAKPDLILTHNPGDYHQDHRTAGEIMLSASFIAAVPHAPPFSAPPHAQIPALYYMDSLAGANFIPEEYVDITETFDTKRRALECHQSQLKWLKEHDGIDTLDFIEVAARFRGLTCGVKYAEGFKRLNVWGRAGIERLLP